MSSYIKRSIEKVLKKAVSQFPAVILTGPRQAGKTTLLQQMHPLPSAGIPEKRTIHV